MFSVVQLLGWENDNIAPPGIQAFVGGKITVTGNALTLAGDVRDVPARRLIRGPPFKSPT